MAVSKVKVASVIGVMSALDEVVKVCGETGYFHPDDALSFYSKTEKFLPITETNPYEEPLKKIKEIAELAEVELHFTDVHEFDVSIREINDYVNYLTGKLGGLLDKKKETLAKIEAYKKSLDQIKHFAGLNLNLGEIFSCKYIRVRFGRLPKESYLKLNAYEDNNPYMLFFPCTMDDDYCWGVYFTPVEERHEIDRKFAGLYFERLRIDKNEGTPETVIKNLEESIKKSEEELSKLEDKISSYWKTQKEQCMRFYTKLEELNTYFGIKKYASKYNDNFILVGWIPKDEEDDFADRLSKIYGIEYSVDRAEDEYKHSPPVKLKNRWFSKPFEMFVGMYGLPSYNEIDPTFLVSIVYTILYGIMFGDLGQGIVLAIAGAIMWKKKQMVLGKILVRCGISGAIFGFFYGSVFGFEDLLNPIHQRLFGVEHKLFEIMESHGIMMILLSSIGIGVFLITLAMVINVYSAFRRRDYQTAIFSQNGIAGLVFYDSLIAGVLMMAMGKNVFTLPYILGLIVLPVVVIFLQEPLGKLIRGERWLPEKIGEFIIQNFFELFEILLTYVTNTVSFLRVGAYILIHAGMMIVGFTIADIIPGGVVSDAIILTFWNALIIVLEGTLVAIQVLRLNYYEMFSRFFEGQGREFTPVKLERN